MKIMDGDEKTEKRLAEHNVRESDTTLNFSFLLAFCFISLQLSIPYASPPRSINVRNYQYQHNDLPKEALPKDLNLASRRAPHTIQIVLESLFQTAQLYS